MVHSLTVLARQFIMRDETEQNKSHYIKQTTMIIFIKLFIKKIDANLYCFIELCI
jgi:hypothetical protein